jgi:hypothetical protein
MEDFKRGGRRRYDAALKTKVLGACDELGASVARVALVHGLNANLVHKWRHQATGSSHVRGRYLHPVDFGAEPGPGVGSGERKGSVSGVPGKTRQGWRRRHQDSWHCGYLPVVLLTW